ncbi:MAG TPA: hypothetical protein VFJ43_08190, partial [Bacteroidia bacterium]|nr:hypothetical protein [Bacteroidia bacterium]
MNSAENLIQELLIGKKKVNDLEWEEVEDIVTYKVIEDYISEKGIAIQVVRNRQNSEDRGEIDVIIRIQRNSFPVGGKQIFQKEDEYFIECKWHNKNLPLDTVAKAFCAAIRYSPVMLVLVSKYPLAPQAFDYAHYLFGKDGKGGLFRNIYFSRTTIEDLIGLTENENVVEDLVDAEAIPQIKLDDWCIYENGAFSQKIVCNKSDRQSFVNVSR